MRRFAETFGKHGFFLLSVGKVCNVAVELPLVDSHFMKNRFEQTFVYLMKGGKIRERSP